MLIIEVNFIGSVMKCIFQYRYYHSRSWNDETRKQGVNKEDCCSEGVQTVLEGFTYIHTYIHTYLLTYLHTYSLTHAMVQDIL